MSNSMHTQGDWRVELPSEVGANSRRIFAGDEYIGTIGGSDQSMEAIEAVETSDDEAGRDHTPMEDRFFSIFIGNGFADTIVLHGWSGWSGRSKERFP